MGIDERGAGLDESSSDDIRSGVTRREAIKKGAIVGGTVMWVAPLVQTVGMSPASAEGVSPPPGECVCTGTESFDVQATLAGLINANVGPIQNFPEENDCLANLSVTATGTVNAFLTADVDCVGGTTTGGTCSAFVELTNLDTDLRALNAALDVQLDASLVRAEATCTCGGGCTARSCITQVDGQAIVTIGGTAVLVGTGVEICERQEIAINLSTSTSTVTGTIVLNDTSTDPCQATVATINATVDNLLGLDQEVNIVIGRATARCTQA